MNNFVEETLKELRDIPATMDDEGEEVIKCEDLFFFHKIEDFLKQKLIELQQRDIEISKDKNGIPVHVGDTLKYKFRTREENYERTGTVIFQEYMYGVTLNEPIGEWDDWVSFNRINDFEVLQR